VVPQRAVSTAETFSVAAADGGDAGPAELPGNTVAVNTEDAVQVLFRHDRGPPDAEQAVSPGHLGRPAAFRVTATIVTEQHLHRVLGVHGHGVPRQLGRTSIPAVAAATEKVSAVLTARCGTTVCVSPISSLMRCPVTTPPGRTSASRCPRRLATGRLTWDHPPVVVLRTGQPVLQ